MSAQQIDIPLLIEGCKKNERKAQEALYRHFYPFAAAIALRYVKCNDDMADVVSLAFIKLFKALPTFDTKRGSFHAWFKTIVIHEALDHIKAHSKYTNSQEVADEEPTIKPDTIRKQDFKHSDTPKRVPEKNTSTTDEKHVVDTAAFSAFINEKTDSLSASPVIKMPPPGMMNPSIDIKQRQKYGVEVSDSDYRFKVKPKE